MLLVSSVVCPVSGVLSNPSPLSPSFLAAKIFCWSVWLYNQKISWLTFCSHRRWTWHCCLTLLTQTWCVDCPARERSCNEDFYKKLLALGPPQIFKLQISDRLAGARCSQTIQTTLSMTRGVIWLSTLWFTELITSSLQLLTCQFWKTLAKAIWRALSRSCGTFKNKKLKKC